MHYWKAEIKTSFLNFLNTEKIFSIKEISEDFICSYFLCVNKNTQGNLVPVRSSFLRLVSGKTRREIVKSVD